MSGWVWLCSWLTCWVTMWCPDVSASLNFAPLFILKIIRLNRNLGLKLLVWKRSFQARLTSMVNNFKNMLWAFLRLELNWGFSSFHNFGGRPTFSPALGIFSFRFCSLELGIRSSPSCCVQGKLETLKVSLDLWTQSSVICQCSVGQKKSVAKSLPDFLPVLMFVYANNFFTVLTWSNLIKLSKFKLVLKYGSSYTHLLF